MTRRDDLEALIRADPDEPVAFRVYADWLQGQGDPAGELMALQLRAIGPMTAEESAARASEEEAFFARHHDEYIEPLTGFRIVWRWGFVHSIRVPRATAATGGPLAVRLASLLEQPVVRFLRRLRLEGDAHLPLENLFDVVKDAGPATLDHLDCAQDELPPTVLQRIGEVAPRLRSLSLSGVRVPLDALRLPHLQQLDFVPLEMSRAELLAFGQAPWDGLEFLRLGGLHHEVTAENLEQAIGALPRLRSLYIGGLGSRQLDAFFEGLGYSKAIALEELLLGVLNPGLPAALARHAALLRNVRRIRLALPIAPADQNSFRLLFGDRITFGERGL